MRDQYKRTLLVHVPGLVEVRQQTNPCAYGPRNNDLPNHVVSVNVSHNLVSHSGSFLFSLVSLRPLRPPWVSPRDLRPTSRPTYGATCPWPAEAQRTQRLPTSQNNPANPVQTPGLVRRRRDAVGVKTPQQTNLCAMPFQCDDRQFGMNAVVCPNPDGHRDCG